MLSHWERDSLLHCDVIIVGGGIVGLSVAASIKEKYPKREVMVLERSILPYGASTRNAGFACFGSLTEVLHDVDVMGEEAARELLFQRWMGLKITRKRLGDASIGFKPSGGYELIDASHIEAMEHIAEVNALVEDFIPEYIEDRTNEKESMGIQAEGSLVSMKDEGQVDTGQLMKSLERYALSKGVIVRSGAEVVSVHSDRVEVKDGFRGTVTFTCDQAIICANAFSKRFLPDESIEPGRGQVFLTSEISNLRFRGNIHIDEGFYYLRNVGNRILFGGARNHFMQEESSDQLEVNQKVVDHLQEKLQEVFGTSLSWEVEAQWSGIMGFGAHKLPIVKCTEDGVIVAVRMAGMGIALAGYIGEEVAEMMA